MQRVLLFILCVGVLAFCQNPGADISAWYRMTPASPPLYRWLNIPAPHSVDNSNPDHPILRIAPLTIRMVNQFGANPTVIGTATTLDLVAGANVILAATQTAPGIVRVQISTPGWCQTDPASGAVTSCTSAFVPGPGLRLTEDSPTRQLIVDSDYATSRVPIGPLGANPGPCQIGLSAFMQDANGYEYKCFPKPDGSYTLRRSPQPWVEVWP